MALTKAARLLKERLAPPKPSRLPSSQSELARELDVSPQAVSAWVNGESIPSPEKMLKIQRLFPDIVMQDWVKEDESEESGQFPAVEEPTGTESR